MANIEINKVEKERVFQGDIYKNIEYIEGAETKGDIIEISKIVFPFVIVLTQDCDLAQDFDSRAKKNNQDKILISVIIAPLYNAEHVFRGEHLSMLKLQMQEINGKTRPRLLKQNQLPRYHYLEMKEDEDVPIVASVIDFKHYFTVNKNYLLNIKKNNYICRVNELYRENISQRFCNFLSRIALP